MAKQLRQTNPIETEVKYNWPKKSRKEKNVLKFLLFYKQSICDKNVEKDICSQNLQTEDKFGFQH